VLATPYIRVFFGENRNSFYLGFFCGKNGVSILEIPMVLLRIYKKPYFHKIRKETSTRDELSIEIPSPYSPLILFPQHSTAPKVDNAWACY
jgi:hypothetical protein